MTTLPGSAPDEDRRLYGLLAGPFLIILVSSVIPLVSEPAKVGLAVLCGLLAVASGAVLSAYARQSRGRDIANRPAPLAGLEPLRPQSQRPEQSPNR